MNVGSLPEWLGPALFAAALATVGFVGKQIIEWAGAVRSARRARRARLVTLLSLLNGSAAVFRVQAELRDLLCASVNARRPELNAIEGFDAILTAAFPQLNDEEKRLHALIRGYTVFGLKPINEAMIQWLAIDTEFKLARTPREADVQLARELGALEPHLLMWVAKYSAWIPDHPEHALVYLSDEKAHGVPFPDGIEKTIKRVLDVDDRAA